MEGLFLPIAITVILVITYSWATNKKNLVVKDLSDNVRISIRTSSLSKTVEYNDMCKELGIEATQAPELMAQILK